MNLFSKENLEKESFKRDFYRTCSALIRAFDLLMALAAPGGDMEGWGWRGLLVVSWVPAGWSLEVGQNLLLGHPRALCRVPEPSCLQTVLDPPGLQGVGELLGTGAQSPRKQHPGTHAGDMLGDADHCVRLLLCAPFTLSLNSPSLLQGLALPGAPAPFTDTGSVGMKGWVMGVQWGCRRNPPGG